MKRSIIYCSLAAAVGALIGGSFAFWFGARVGAEELLYADAKYRASVVAFQIGRLQRQDAATVTTMLENDLNSQLANHGRYLQSNWKWLFPELQSVDDREIRDAVKFRIENPFSPPDMASPSSWKSGMDMNDPFVLGVIAGQRENKALVESVLSRYAK